MNRQSFWKFLRTHQWKLLLVLFAICIILGYIGFDKYTRSLNSDYSVTDLFYLTLQLATIESGAISGPISWELEVARFLTPLVAAYTAVLAVAAIFRKQLDLFRMRILRGHTIICGLGEKGWLLASELRQTGESVVVIEMDPTNPRIDLSREVGIIVLERDARETENLAVASIKTANNLVAICGDESINAEIAVTARQLSVGRKRGALNCSIHITNPKLYDLLRELEFGFMTFPTFRLEIFNIFERGARYLVSEYTSLSQEKNQKLGHGGILVVGCSRLGESLILQIARTWYETWKAAGTKLGLTVVDKNAEVKITKLAAMYPNLSECCHLTLHNFDVEDADFQKGKFLFNGSGKCDFDSIFICLDDTTRGLASALNLRQRLGSSQPPIILYLPEDSGLAKLLEDEQGSNNPVHNIIPFRLVQSTCTPDLVINGTHEILARSVHKDYLRQRFAEGIQMGQKRSMAYWEDLPEDLRESNRRQVDHIQIKLQKIGYGIEPLHDWDASYFQFSPVEVEMMAQMEHEHWIEERLRSGWTFAPSPEDPINKTHPDLVPWDQLTETDREKDRQTIYTLPRTLARAGFQVFKWHKN
ncbi:MAG: RyR domain-containing protein [Chloroflexota bacterium]|nr:RyR domain-containing protein [Chloroflexota bacterium]